MQMKLFYANSRGQIQTLEAEVNEWLGKLPAASKIFAVNTAAVAQEGQPTLTVTVWYGS